MPVTGEKKLGVKRATSSDAKAEEVLSNLTGSPTFFISMAVVALHLMLTPDREPWRDGLPRVNGKKNSAWRGRGSFGSAPFGPQTTR